jgi:hypothetical protein
MLLRLRFTEKISPFELILVWLFNKVSNQPLPERCIDKIAKNRTGVHTHSFLTNKEEICNVTKSNLDFVIYNNYKNHIINNKSDKNKIVNLRMAARHCQ